MTSLPQVSCAGEVWLILLYFFLWKKIPDLFVVGFRLGVMRFSVNSPLVFGSVNSCLVLLLLFLDFDLGSWDLLHFAGKILWVYFLLSCVFFLVLINPFNLRWWRWRGRRGKEKKKSKKIRCRWFTVTSNDHAI